MKKTTLSILSLWFTILTVGQANNDEKLIELGKAYKDFMFRNEPTNKFFKDLKANVPENLKNATKFIVQTITTKNNLLTQQFLSRPDNQTLRQIFIIRAINRNLRTENQVNNNKLIDSLTTADMPTYELVNNYYEILFTAIGNKNQPFDFSKVDFKFKDYNLKDDTEKGILFLQCIRLCNSTIWGYMNIVKPPNTKKAYNNIKKYPKINGQPYYQYTDFYFTDFEINIIEDKGPQSYKSYYLDKFYEILLYHLLCLNKEGGTEKEKNDLLLGSILKTKNLYKYTKYKKVLEEICQEQKVN